MDDEIFVAVKAVGDWELDINAAPFNKRDSDGQWFDENTDTMPGVFKTPAVIYQHGIDGGKLSSNPIVPGKTVDGSLQKKPDGWHIRVVLDKTNQVAAKLWDAAKRGAVAVSSDSIAHLARLDVGGKSVMYQKNKPGRISVWPLAGVSIWENAPGNLQPANKAAYALPALKSTYELAGLELPDLPEMPESEVADSGDEGAKAIKPERKEETKMDEKSVDIQALVAEELQKQLAAKAAIDKAESDKRAEIEAAVKAERIKWDAEAAKSRRLPTFNVNSKFTSQRRYENVETADLALSLAILESPAVKAKTRQDPSPELYQALGVRVLEGKSEGEIVAGNALKAAGFAGKSDEVMQQDLTSYGDEWVGVAYGTTLWEKIRYDAKIASQIPTQVIPKGYETFYDPTEGADPTWYKVAETTAEDSTMKFPVASVPSSKAGTGRVNETLGKLGARVQWSGELDEDSLVEMASIIRGKLTKSGTEILDHVVIDGDTETGATTNINDIGGTPAGTEAFMTFNGFRKLCLVTNTANSASAAGGFTAENFLDAVKLMGIAGRNAIDRSKVSFILSAPTHWKALQLPEVKTRDVFAAPTLENGQLTGIYGYRVEVSPFMHLANLDATYGLKANSAGKLDLDTAANNLYGAILAVRWDQWKLGWKRRMTIETERIPRSDSYEITALMRLGMKYYDTDASAIVYYVGV